VQCLVPLRPDLLRLHELCVLSPEP
jgi:hypothetical protein